MHEITGLAGGLEPLRGDLAFEAAPAHPAEREYRKQEQEREQQEGAIGEPAANRPSRAGLQHPQR
jgi:hypothetical protein